MRYLRLTRYLLPALRHGWKQFLPLNAVIAISVALMTVACTVAASWDGALNRSLADEYGAHEVCQTSQPRYADALRHAEGVIAVDEYVGIATGGERSVAVDVVGLPPDTTFRGVRLEGASAISMGGAGISQALAQAMGLRIGDNLSLEIPGAPRMTRAVEAIIVDANDIGRLTVHTTGVETSSDTTRYIVDSDDIAYHDQISRGIQSYSISLRSFEQLRERSLVTKPAVIAMFELAWLWVPMASLVLIALTFPYIRRGQRVTARALRACGVSIRTATAFNTLVLVSAAFIAIIVGMVLGSVVIRQFSTTIATYYGQYWEEPRVPLGALASGVCVQLALIALISILSERKRVTRVCHLSLDPHPYVYSGIAAIGWALYLVTAHRAAANERAMVFLAGVAIMMVALALPCACVSIVLRVKSRTLWRVLWRSAAPLMATVCLSTLIGSGLVTWSSAELRSLEYVGQSIGRLYVMDVPADLGQSLKESYSALSGMGVHEITLVADEPDLRRVLLSEDPSCTINPGASLTSVDSCGRTGIVGIVKQGDADDFTQIPEVSVVSADIEILDLEYGTLDVRDVHHLSGEGDLWVLKGDSVPVEMLLIADSGDRLTRIGLESSGLGLMVFHGFDELNAVQQDSFVRYIRRVAPTSSVMSTFAVDNVDRVITIIWLSHLLTVIAMSLVIVAVGVAMGRSRVSVWRLLASWGVGRGAFITWDALLATAMIASSSLVLMMTALLRIPGTGSDYRQLVVELLTLDIGGLLIAIALVALGNGLSTARSTTRRRTHSGTE